jgi:hypothetical protein
MAEFEVKVRNLKTGETLVASMPDSAACIEWLSERPPYIEILTVLSDVSPADQRRLKEAMRPYDAEELALKRSFDMKRDAAMQAQYAEELAQIEKDRSEPVDPDADPDRPMSVKYEIDEGLTVVDDDRKITDAARDACLAWVKERNEWVAGKGQIVGEAHLEVYPGKVPEGDESARVLPGGRFYPRLKDAPKGN